MNKSLNNLVFNVFVKQLLLTFNERWKSEPEKQTFSCILFVNWFVKSNKDEHFYTFQNGKLIWF